EPSDLLLQHAEADQEEHLGIDDFGEGGPDGPRAPRRLDHLDAGLRTAHQERPFLAAPAVQDPFTVGRLGEPGATCLVAEHPCMIAAEIISHRLPPKALRAVSIARSAGEGPRGSVQRRAAGSGAPPPANDAATAWASRGCRNSYPAASSRSGSTQRLLRISSVSVRRPIAPSSSIQRGVGTPIRTPRLSRTVRMSSALSTGWGEERFTGPARDGVVSRKSRIPRTS